MENKNHPALMVTNIRNFVPFTLEMESGQYNSWAELFKIHCRAFLVYDHIDASVQPPTLSETQTNSSDKEKDATPKPKVVSQDDIDLWYRLDAIVLQWIYSTISNDLLHTILKTNATALEAWTSLQDIFQDNKNERALFLEHKLVTTRLENYPNMSAYCQAVKMLADQLSNVGAPVTNQRIVLQLIGGLTSAYDGIAMIIQQIKPLPGFYEVRSRLCMEESRKANQAHYEAASSGSALHVHQPRPNGEYRTQSNRGRGRGRGGRGRGGNRGRNDGSTQSYGRGSGSKGGSHVPNTQAWPTSSYGPQASGPLQNSQWPYPPCPYPATPMRPQQGPYTGQGLLGPRPQNHQAYATSELSYAPTDVEQALHALSLNSSEPQGIFDTGATGHMTNNSGLPDADTYPPM
ncbi:uncharacterized protein LOC110886769 [Helianthus annuus]|nr:uncharacterized protein LOC110886769 [Helianthus annuus]